ncbi:hypothetical protein KM043_013740 [Ampulex compressa]|nr:hypothetical protein KM043_013740 [Ampulex compressa]
MHMRRGPNGIARHGSERLSSKVFALRALGPLPENVSSKIAKCRTDSGSTIVLTAEHVEKGYEPMSVFSPSP